MNGSLSLYLLVSASLRILDGTPLELRILWNVSGRMGSSWKELTDQHLRSTLESRLKCPDLADEIGDGLQQLDNVRLLLGEVVAGGVGGPGVVPERKK